MCGALKKAGIQTPDWEKIGKALKFSQQLPISASIFFESWHAYSHDCQPSWNQLADALEQTSICNYKQAAEFIRAKEGMKNCPLCFNTVPVVHLHSASNTMCSLSLLCRPVDN